MLKIQIETVGAAFCDEQGEQSAPHAANETARILHLLAERIEEVGTVEIECNLADRNGNTVGSAVAE